MLADRSLMSPAHRARYLAHYAQNPVRSRPSHWLTRIESVAEAIGATRLIDYGCGAARGVSRFSRFPVDDYDPGVPGLEVVPAPADLVVSVHMLEHVEDAAAAQAAIDHMTQLARRAVFLVVSCEPSTKLLPDGTPWHSFVLSADDWRSVTAKLGKFRVRIMPTIKPAEKEFAVLLIKNPPG